MSPDQSVGRALENRAVLPRWRSPGESVDEMLGVGSEKNKQPDRGWIKRLLRDFNDAPTAATAAELRESAFALGEQLPADVLMRMEGFSRGALHPNSNTPSFDQGVHDKGIAIRALRKKISLEPRQPFAWSELARNQLANGDSDGAVASMACATQLAPTNRYILRSAVRLLSHVPADLDGDRVSWLLKRSGSLTRDPWLLSAEIAASTAADKTSDFIGRAKKMLMDNKFHPRHLAELAAAVGTVEHQYGRHKKAKENFAQSMIDPNENAVAQALYVAQDDKKIVVPSDVLARPGSFETHARLAYTSGAWADVAQQCRLWLSDEPFDTRPAVLGSYLSFEPALVQQAQVLATMGLRCSPQDYLLLNNRAVAYAYSGLVAEAYSDIRSAVRIHRSHPHIMATLGLIACRAGYVEYGLALYEQTIAWFAYLKDRDSLIRAVLYWLREAVRAGTTEGSAELSRVRAWISRLPQRDQESEIRGLIEAVEREQGMARLGDDLSYSGPLTVNDFEELKMRIDAPQESFSYDKSIPDSELLSRDFGG